MGDRMLGICLVALGLIVHVTATARAACNFVVGERTAFESTQGVTNAPFAGPGDRVEIAVRPCDRTTLAATDLVTVVFTPPSGLPNAVVLTSAAGCDAVNPLLAACEASLGGGRAACVPDAAADVELVLREGIPNLSFRFPDTDRRCVGGAGADRVCLDDAGCPGSSCAPADGVTLAGPARIAVSPADTATLPCAVAAQPCGGAGVPDDVVACVDAFFERTGGCVPGAPNVTFPGFTALAPAADFQSECFREDPPCDNAATTLPLAIDAGGNVLLPVDWSGVRVTDGGRPVARLVRGTLALPVTIPGSSFVGAFSPEGRLLDPVFDPESIGTNVVSLFGSTKSPYSVLRIARRSDSFRACNGGANDGLPCNDDAECAGNLCEMAQCTVSAGACTSDADCVGGAGDECGDSVLPDLAALAAEAGTGPVVVTKDSGGGAGICQDDPTTACTTPANCGGRPCVLYSFEAETPVPLTGLLGSAQLRDFVVRESIDGVDRNGDGDTADSVVTLRDRATGARNFLGFTAGCGIVRACIGGVNAGMACTADVDCPDGLCGPDGRAVILQELPPPFSFPAVAAEDDLLAFLESEAATNDAGTGAACDVNGDFDTFDQHLRAVRLGPEDLTATLDLPADAAPVIDDRSLAISNGLVFFRTSEAGIAEQQTTRVSELTGGGQLTGDGILDGPSDSFAFFGVLSRDGSTVVFDTGAENIPGDNNPYRDVYRYSRGSSTLTRISTSPGGETDGTSRNGVIDGDGEWIAFESGATNIESPTFDDNGFLDVYLFHPTLHPNPTRASRANGGGATDGNSLTSALSGSGEWLAFRSAATNLLPVADGNAFSDIFVRQTQAFAGNVRVSVPDESGPAPGGVANGTSTCPVLSESGRHVAFASLASNLVANDTNGQRDIFVHDRDADEDGMFDETHAGARRTERVNVATDGTEDDLASVWCPRISADGRYVAFSSQGTALAPGLVGTKDRVYVRDRRTGVTSLVSRPTGGTGDGGIVGAISDDGRFVAFTSTDPLVPEDTNGTDDAYVRDTAAGVTTRVTVTTTGGQATGGGSGGPWLSGDGRQIAFQADATNLVAGDTNDLRDVFVRAVNPTDPLGADTLYPDGALDDTVLRVLDTTVMPATATTLCPATQVAVADGGAAFLFPEQSAGGTVACPSGSLNAADADTDDAVAHLWSGAGNPVSYECAATLVRLSDDWLAALVDETGEGADLNGDADTDDAVVRVHPRAGGAPTACGDWTSVASPEQAADTLVLSGGILAFITPERDQGADVTGDGDQNDRGVQFYDADADVLTNPGFAAEELVMGAPEAAAPCSPIHLIPFRSPEAGDGAGVDQNGDGDAADDVLVVYDAVSRTVTEVGRHVLPCPFEACDPRVPYRVRGSKVIFITDEAQQGGQDLSGEGQTDDLVLSVFDYCTGATSTLGVVDARPTDDPLGIPEDSTVLDTPAGRCDTGGPACTTDAECGAGAYCEEDVCDTATGTCALHSSVACAADATCHRCILRVPPVCLTDADCPAGTCEEQVVSVSTSAADGDGDGVPDDVDNCPGVANAPVPPSLVQADGDGDGVGDACDAFPVACDAAPRTGCFTPVVGEKALLIVKDRSPAVPDRKDLLVWKWLKGATTGPDFADPSATDDVTLCGYDDTGEVFFSAGVAAGGTCGRRACWKALSSDKGFRYRDKNRQLSGVLVILMRSGLDGSAKVIVKAKGENVPMPDLPLAFPVRMQLQSENGNCWEALYPDAIRNDADQVKARAGP